MRPWFSDRPLRFSCTRCGDCCRRPGYVLVTASEAERIAERVGGEDARVASLDGSLWTPLADGGRIIEVVEGAGCPLLGEDGCTVHDIKPIQCATYPFWPEIVLAEEAWDAERRWCEGICATGRPYDADEIVRLMRDRARTAESAPEAPAGESD